jgi:hypothetical protein
MEVRNHRHLIEEKAKGCTGGHALGSGSDILYEPDGLVGQASTDGTPLIYVAINYRLGCKTCTRPFLVMERSMLISCFSIRFRNE